MNIAASGASVPRRGIARMASLFGWLALAFVFLASAAPARAEDQSSIILNLRGDETPETIRRMVDALSTPGRQVEIRVGGVPSNPAATPSAEQEGQARCRSTRCCSVNGR